MMLPCGLFNGAPVEGPISLLYVSTESVSISNATTFSDTERAAGTIAMCGKVISNPVVSPFGDITGSAAFAGGFTIGVGDAATFKLLGGPVAGSHATFLKDASGVLHIKRPWQSY